MNAKRYNRNPLFQYNNRFIGVYCTTTLSYTKVITVPVAPTTGRPTIFHRMKTMEQTIFVH